MGGGTEVKREDCQREESRVRKGTLEEVWGRGRLRALGAEFTSVVRQ